GVGRQYATFVGEELPNYIKKTFNLCQNNEDTYIGGLSMGGFGALHTGLLYAQTFSKIAALSSALIVHNIAHMQPNTSDLIADYDYYSLTFGDLEKVEKSDNNPEVLLKKLKSEGKIIPQIYMACGTEDFLLKENREFKTFLDMEKIKAEYVEGHGTHDWEYWNRHLEKFIKWMLQIS
ncbi:MAG: alpha/beta hydrolase-fold protein, partial [Christensenella sp.]